MREWHICKSVQCSPTMQAMVIEDSSGTEDWCLITNTGTQPGLGQSQIASAYCSRFWAMYNRNATLVPRGTDKVVNVALCFKARGATLTSAQPYQATRIQEEGTAGTSESSRMRTCLRRAIPKEFDGFWLYGESSRSDRGYLIMFGYI